MKQWTWTIVAACVISQMVWAASKPDPVAATNRVTAVTLYRNSAMVTRTVELPAKAGELELLIEHLPQSMTATSLSAVGGEGVVVRMVQYRRKTIQAKQDPKAIEAIKADLEQCDVEMALLGQHNNLLSSKRNYINKLEGFTTTRVSKEVADGKSDFASAKAMTDYIFTQRDALSTESIRIEGATRDLKKRRTALGTKMRLAQGGRGSSAQQSQSGTRQENQAILYVNKADAKPSTVQLQYVVHGTSWSPSYLARLTEASSSVKLDYTASVYQSTGEDWDKVTLTLSTAQPMLNCEIPLVAPITYGATPTVANAKKAPGGNLLLEQQGQARGWNRKSGSQMSQSTILLSMNHIANASQNFEMLATKGTIQRRQAEARRQLQGMAVTYAIGTITVSSQPAVQLLPITSAKLECTLYYEATPLLSPFVYRGARIVNTTGSLLLDGEYKAYVGSEFVGRGNMSRTANGQVVNLGFGVDTQLLAHRELMDKDESTSWGNRRQWFQYELRIENFSKTPRTVQLYDRIPSTKLEEVTIKLTKTSQPLCSDKAYQKMLAPKGILRWDVTVAPGQQGVEANTVGYTYEIKSPKSSTTNKAATSWSSTVDDGDFDKVQEYRRRN